MPSLAAFQQDFLRRIDSSETRETPLAVYRNTALLGAITAIADNFPTVARIVGIEAMEAIAGEFVTARPPDSPVLANYGEAFADFLDAHPIAQELPYLPGIALIDRLRIESHLAADAPEFALKDLVRLSADEWSRSRVVLHPATRMSWFRIPCPSIWVAHIGEDPGELEPEWKAEGILIARRRGAVSGIVLGPCEHRILHGLRIGETVAQASLAASGLYAAANVSRAFRAIVASGAIASLRLKG